MNAGTFASTPPAPPALTPPVPAGIGGGSGGRAGATGVGDDIPVTSKVTLSFGEDAPRSLPERVTISPF